LTGSFNNGKLKGPETSVLLIKKANVSLGSADYSCSLTIENLNTLKLISFFR